MKTSNSPVGKGDLGLTGLILLSVALGAGTATAETFRHGGSTATIEQSGGGTSRSEVTRYKDGQKIVTQDGSSTDITIQGGSGSVAADYGWGHPYWGAYPFDRRWIEERFSRGTDDDPEFTMSSEREAFKRMMKDRMRSRFWP